MLPTDPTAMLFDPTLINLTEEQFLRVLRGIEHSGRRHGFTRDGTTWWTDEIRWAGVKVTIGLHFPEGFLGHIDLDIARPDEGRIRTAVIAALGLPTDFEFGTLGEPSAWATVWNSPDREVYLDITQESVGLSVFFYQLMVDALGHAEAS